MKRALLALTAAVFLAVAGCSSAGGDTAGADVAKPDVSPGDASEHNAPEDDEPGMESLDADSADAGASDDEAPADNGLDVAAGGPTCDVLLTLYQDITTLAARVEDEGVTNEDVEVIMGPAEAMRHDLPGVVRTVLPILRNDVKAAVVMSSAADIEEYFERSTHELAIESLISSTRTACDLSSSWPEAG